jgi:5-methyltetrahydropteroyltriglutamate--homocysteine methyltransferase
MNSKPLTHTLGYPRIGENRELKRATEAYWQGRLSRAELEETGRSLRRQNWLTQQKAGIDLIPSNDFSFYDQMLDLTCLLGNVPHRFGRGRGDVDLDTRFAVARGVRPQTGLVDAALAGEAPVCGCPDCTAPATATFASEMTKWFDTNYHYIVPEFHAETPFKLSATKPFDEFSEALALGIKTKPVLIGPVTYLKLGSRIRAIRRSTASRCWSDCGRCTFKSFKSSPRSAPNGCSWMNPSSRSISPPTTAPRSPRPMPR